MVHKFYHYCGASLLAVTAIVSKEAYVHQQFYTTVVSLTTSKLSRVALYNAAFVLLILLGKCLQRLFLGDLKPREVEKAFEQTFYYVATTCLALTIFREHMNSMMLGLFVLCLFVKTFHWLAQSRQEYIEQMEFQDDSGKWWEYIRLFMLLVTLGTADLTMSTWYIYSLLKHGPSVRLLLALEYLVMSITFMSLLIRLILHIVDDCNHHRWENKGKYKFYLEIFSDLLQCILYMGFFLVILWFYGIPIHLMRELFLTLRSFRKTISDFIRYRKLIACLDERYPNATEAEIARDPQCIICYDDMTQQAKKLPCGHIFHKHCLKSWMERNNKCPYCNKETLLDPPRAARRQQPAQPPAEPVQQATPAPPAAAAPAPEKKKRGKESSKSKARQQQLEQIQQQQQAMQMYMQSWLQQMNQAPSMTPSQISTSSGTGSLATVAQPTVETGASPASSSASNANVQGPETSTTSATVAEANADTSLSNGASPPALVFPQAAVQAAYQQQCQQYYGACYGGYSQPLATHAGIASPLQSQPAAPANAEQAEAYAEFHQQMGAIYTEMASTVNRIAQAYTNLAEKLRMTDRTPQSQGGIAPSAEPVAPTAQPSPEPPEETPSDGGTPLPSKELVVEPHENEPPANITGQRLD